MTDEQKDAIEQLERRVATLENIVRRLTFVGSLPARPSGPKTPIVRAALPSTPASHSQPTDLEQWFGQRGLLAVGVAALLIAAAFFLKHAFDRGWVPPLLRSLGAVVVGIGVAAWGHERIGRGMRRYGAALIGAGGGLVYLGLWAAAGPYALVDRRVGILLLAATTVAVTLVALHHEIEGLALWALTGAFLAPLILVPPVPNPQAFLGYLEVIGLGTGILAYTMSWRRTFDLALFGYLLLAMSGALLALETPVGCWLVAAAGVLALHVTNLKAWPEARLGVLLLTWGALVWGIGSIEGPTTGHWIGLAAAGTVAALLWWQHLQRDPFTTPLEGFLFVTNPIVLLIGAEVAQIPLLQSSPQIVPAVLGAIYVLAAWPRRSASFLITGFALAAFAIAQAWDGPAVAIGWTVLSLVALAAERNAGRPGGRHASAALATAAFLCLFSSALSLREPSAPVFTDSWALALYLFVAATAVAARWWGGETAPGLWMRGGPEWLWILCASAVFAGGSIEFYLAFGRVAVLAGDLALSVWWLLYAGTLVWLGFRLDRKMIRSAGLMVAAAAGFKIVLYDLATLEALYRVGSFFALALIALAVAYAYNRRARVSAA